MISGIPTRESPTTLPNSRWKNEIIPSEKPVSASKFLLFQWSLPLEIVAKMVLELTLSVSMLFTVRILLHNHQNLSIGRHSVPKNSVTTASAISLKSIVCWLWGEGVNYFYLLPILRRLSTNSIIGLAISPRIRMARLIQS